MAGWHLDTKMAQDIVARTMRIIDTNINVMDARGRIIGSGDRERIGELHEGALLVLSQGRVVDIAFRWATILPVLAVLPDPIVRRKRRWWWVNSGCQKVAAIFIRI